MSDVDWDPNIYEADPRPADEVSLANNGRTAVIRNSDRASFRKCRRRWGWNSHLRGNLGPKEQASPLWFGTGIHFALEEIHALKRYGSGSEAFLAYVEATRRKAKHTLPGDWIELKELGVAMMDYYQQDWLTNRDPITTFVYNDIPQAEVNFRIDIPWEPGKFNYDKVVYSGTLDRVGIDEHGRLWIIEYKTAKQIMTMHLPVDGQVSSYCWAGQHLYPGHEIAGVVYQQHLKRIPEEPAVLMSGKVSTNKTMSTTHALYRKMLIKIYGEVSRAPLDNVNYLNFLASEEDEDKDKYIRRDRLYRNDHQCQAEGVKILMEIDEMLNPNLAMYPNPTRDCTFMCPFVGPCVSLDDGGDWEYELEIMMTSREKDYDSWRKYLTDFVTPPEQQ